MHILNVMFGRGLGGIEQSFMDYSSALVGQGQQVTSLVHPKSAILPELKAKNLPVEAISNWGIWDPIATHQITRLLKTIKPDVVIAHGGRAAALLKKAAGGEVKVVGVCHNGSIRRMLQCDMLFTVTEALRQQVIQAGYDAHAVHSIPNMISLPDHSPSLPKTWKNPPVIGTLGRFVEKKGFVYFIEALRILQLKGVACQAILAGDGEEAGHLKDYAQQTGVSNILTFPGWAKDKTAFFEAIDIFCLPSLEESFGIVLLEAFNHGVPVVGTECEGPKEIIERNHNGLLVPCHNAEALAAALERLMQDKPFADQLALAGYHNVETRYAMPVVAKRILHALAQPASGDYSVAAVVQ